jgi:predicted nuclease of predicted toxin-antitoxin system
MKLLLDENISSKLVKFFTKDFPESTHIDFLQMQGTTDTNIWEYAQAENHIIVSKDNDFRQRSFLFGSPPKVIWLSVGNGGTKIIKELILKNISVIQRFSQDPTEGLLVLETGRI